MREHIFTIKEFLAHTMAADKDAGSDSKKYVYNLEGMHDYKGVLYLPFMTPELIEETSNLDMSDGDILFGTYPRSGTPLLSEIVWLIHNHADVEAARKTPHGVRVRFMEHMLATGNPLDVIRHEPHPRLLKTHLPATFFTKQTQQSDVKIIQMARNPKDVLVSLYYFYKSPYAYINFPGTWDEFFEIFKNEQIFGGVWLDHVTSWWKLREKANVMLLRYEDVRARPDDVVRNVADFCGKTLDDDQVRTIADYVINDVRQESPLGGWKDFFTVAQLEWFNEKCLSKINDANLEFQYME